MEQKRTFLSSLFFKNSTIDFTALLCIFVGFSAYATGENIPTSKSYVDSAVAQKQDKIPANNGATQILMNTGTPGNIGTKNIYDSTGEYGTQTESLVTAEQFNTAVQNAIDSEFECVGWNPNDQNDCWFIKIKSKEYSKYDLIGKRRDYLMFVRNSLASGTFDSTTKIATILIDTGYNGGNVQFGLGPWVNNYVSGHKYYFYAKMRLTTPGVTVSIYRDTKATVYMNPTTEWSIQGTIFESKFTTTGYPVLECVYPGGNQGVMIDQNVYGVYDLTEIFGAGNEPVTPNDAAHALNLLYMPSGN